jgi:uncharacterized membrane protein YphA (DoxX/SURF4 family)
VAAYEIFPYELARVIGGVLPMVEIALGLLLVAGFATRAMAVVGAALLVTFIAGVASVWARGLSIDCGCFGGGGTRSGDRSGAYAWEIARDLGLLLAAVYLTWYPRSRLSIDERLDAAGQ